MFQDMKKDLIITKCPKCNGIGSCYNYIGFGGSIERIYGSCYTCNGTGKVRISKKNIPIYKKY